MAKYATYNEKRELVTFSEDIDLFNRIEAEKTAQYTSLSSMEIVPIWKDNVMIAYAKNAFVVTCQELVAEQVAKFAAKLAV